MKALQVLAGGAWGGGSVVVHAITRAMIERGDEVWIVSTDPETDARFAEIGARIFQPSQWRRSIHPADIVSFWELLRLCRRERFDLVAAHTSKGGFLGRLAARLAGSFGSKPWHIVYHAHAFFFNHLPPGRERSFYVALERLAAKAGDLILSVSEDHRQGALAAGIEKPERILTVLNGIDLRPFEAPVDRHIARARLGFPASDILIGAVGRLAPYKGLEYLLDALPSVLTEFPGARLALFGDGPLETELRERAMRLGVLGRVSFLGFQRGIAEALAALDIFVQPSLREGLSISLIEALAAGCPIVACRIPGNGEIVDDGVTGLLVPPADSRALAHAIAALLADRERASELASAARRSARVRFCQERMVRENLAAYDHLCQTREFVPQDVKQFTPITEKP